ncbi:MAG: SufE family protein [Planctomycetaceae bacterium]
MKLEPLFAEFDGLDSRERLELLVEFSETLPELSPERAATPPPRTCRVVECQTNVDLWVDVTNGIVHLEAVVPRQAPTIRGLMALLIEGINGSTVDEVLGMPDNVLEPLGLAETLGMARQRGTRGLIAAIKRRAVAAQSA